MKPSDIDIIAINERLVKKNKKSCEKFERAISEWVSEWTKREKQI